MPATKDTFGIEEYYASAFVLSKAQDLVRIRKAIRELKAMEEDAANALRFEIEERGRKSVEFPTLTIRLNIHRQTVCTCHSAAVWDCPEASEGQGITVKTEELPRYVDVSEKTLPLGTLRSV